MFRDKQGEGVLIVYLMGGDPDPSLSLKVVDAVVAGGADIVELGIPFSDPIADGKSIQAAGVRALSSGVRPPDILSIARDAKKTNNLPIAIMTYYNIIYNLGVGRFLDQARRSGVDGVVVPDLPIDESATYCSEAKRRGIDAILLAAPSTPPERIRSLARRTSGFLYLVSLLGVTGPRGELKDSTVRLIRYVTRYTKGRVPLAIGFGISKPEHVRQVLAAGVNGVIVGSAVVDRVSKYGEGEEAMLRDVEGYVRSMKLATNINL